MQYIVGIDEVGRGPLAGPVTVCVVVCEREYYQKLKRRKDLPQIGKDSKKLSPLARERYSNVLKSIKTESSPMYRTLRRTSRKMRMETSVSRTRLDTFADVGIFINFAVVNVSNKVIDKKGIVFSIQSAINTAMLKLKIPVNSKIMLDGGLRAPKHFKNQKTIIKGDEKEKIISWASILAKVERDGLMDKMDRKFPKYNFKKNKGYGTKKHLEIIKKIGTTKIHRKTWIY